MPILNLDGPRYPVLGGLWQPRGGTARHDAVAWGYARAASDLGVDIIQTCEVDRHRPRRRAASPACAPRAAPSAAASSASSSPAPPGVLAELAGFRLPIESVALQALVSEPIKPLLDCVVMANTVHGYISQSDKGEMVIGGGADGFNNYTQRGSFHHIEETLRALIETIPVLSRLKMLRQWGGIVDMTGDRSPIIGPSPVPASSSTAAGAPAASRRSPAPAGPRAEMLAKGAPGELAGPFGLERFAEGRMIDESVAAAVAH